jgi:hypothetical protein
MAETARKQLHEQVNFAKSLDTLLSLPYTWVQMEKLTEKAAQLEDYITNLQSQLANQAEAHLVSSQKSADAEVADCSVSSQKSVLSCSNLIDTHFRPVIFR